MQNPTNEAVKGDILWGKNNKNLKGVRSHYLVYLANLPNEATLFIGAMLTHSPIDGNILMKREHFEEFDKNGDKFIFQFNGTRVVKKLLLKRTEWAPFSKRGKLTKKGIQFLEDNLAGPPEHFSLNA